MVIILKLLEQFFLREQAFSLAIFHSIALKIIFNVNLAIFKIRFFPFFNDLFVLFPSCYKPHHLRVQTAFSYYGWILIMEYPRFAVY